MEIPAGNSITQTAGPHNGSTVAIGTHTVKYTAQDGCGNTTNCSFDITVLPPVPSGGNYCSAGGHTASQVWIKKVQFANIWSQTGSNGGYKYFNSECGSTSAGEYIDLVLMPGFNHNIYKCYWLVYVDYNNDGDFTDRGEYVAKGSGTSTLKGSIRIPPNINNGKKRVRCVMRVGAWPTGPCGNYDYGETEDYCINVTGGWAQDEDQTETRSREESDPIVLASNEYASAEITVHPNPTNGVINVIQKGEGTIANLEVIDAAGRKVMSVQNPTDRNIRLDLADNTAGLYFVRTVFANGEMTVNKISLVK